MAHRRWSLVIWIVAALSLCAAPAFAQRDAKAKEALKKFEEGRTAYNLGEFDRAIELWKAGYELKPDAIFLFNIAQAFRQKKDHERAIFFYKAYLREKPDAPNRPDIEEKIAELQKILDDEAKATATPPTGTEPPDTTDTPPDTTGTPPEDEPEDKPTPTPVEHPGRGMKIAGIVTGGAGVALVITGIVFTLKASSIQSDLQDHLDSGMPWGPAQDSDEAAGKSAATIGAVTIGLGAAAIVGGGVLYFLGAGKDARAREEASAGVEVIPSVGPGGANVLVRWTF